MARRSVEHGPRNTTSDKSEQIPRVGKQRVCGLGLIFIFPKRRLPLSLPSTSTQTAQKSKTSHSRLLTTRRSLSPPIVPCIPSRYIIKKRTLAGHSFARLHCTKNLTSAPAPITNDDCCIFVTTRSFSTRQHIQRQQLSILYPPSTTPLQHSYGCSRR